MSKSIIYAGNSTTQTTTDSGVVVAFPNLVRRYGCNLSLSGGNVTIQGGGYYDVDVNVTVLGTTAGNLTVQVYKDGVAVPYANATQTLVVGDTTSIAIPCTVKECGCGCDCSTITVMASGVVANITNASISVEKE